MSDHPHPGEAVLDGCPYCGDDTIKSESVPAHLPCDAVPSTAQVAEALKERGLWP